MLFPTIQFAIFFVVVLTANWLLLPTPRRWKVFMLAASYVFYGAWDWRFTFLMAGISIANHAVAKGINATSDPLRRKRLLALGVVVSLAVLGWFKYYGFFISSLLNLLNPLGIALPLPLLEITLPVGISFFTFQALTYPIDVYRGRQETVPLLDFMVFVAFFPQLVAGPIVRASEFLPQLHSRPNPRRVQGAEGFLLVAGGLFKKVVVANTLATTLVDPVFASPQNFSGLEVLMGIYGYAVQIFADFSGYTDIAIGCALLMGFRFPQNFNRPYMADSIQDFWRRWHMTLSRWLRDYLYIPLGGNRQGRGATYRNLAVTMVLGGLWHGAAWTFVLWGGLHGAGLALERWLGERRPTEVSASAPGRGLRRLLVFHFVCLGWVLFRSDSVATAATVLSRLSDWGPAPAVTPTVLALIAGGIGVQYLPASLRLQVRAGFARLRPLAMAGALGGFLLILDALGPEGVAPFIYFQF
ncbi:MAG TPA: MBOAT family protein [Acidimicrobiia bacterium]|nr:MBOAT family protein [Acidimicrobiia bacterium]